MNTNTLDPTPQNLTESDATVQHETSVGRLYAVSPTTEADRANRLCVGFPTPAAGWRLYDGYFAFDSSVPRPEISKELRRLRALVTQTGGKTRWASIFAHADPVGDDDYNKKLSGRRARAICALLVRNVDAWLELFLDRETDIWGLQSTQLMLAHLEESGVPYYEGPLNGQSTSATEQAIRRFQRSRRLQEDGTAGPATRRVLYAAYMDAICLSPDESFRMTPDDFLGDPADPTGKAAYQGCGEFNPVRILSQAERQKLKKTERNSRNALNRRTVVFLFDKKDFGPLDGPTIASRWPCSSWNDGVASCKKQFWKDGAERRSPSEKERNFPEDPRTMACAWYDQFARLSPCERSTSPVALKIWLLDEDRKPMRSGSGDEGGSQGTPFRVALDSGEVVTGYGDEQGLATVTGVPKGRSCRVQWGRKEGATGAPPEDEKLAADYFVYSERIHLDTGKGDDGSTLRRLHNLGFCGNEDQARSAFEQQFGAKDDSDIAHIHDGEGGPPGKA